MQVLVLAHQNIAVVVEREIAVHLYAVIVDTVAHADVNVHLNMQVELYQHQHVMPQVMIAKAV